MKPMEKLQEMANYCRKRQTVGLRSDVIAHFVDIDRSLAVAINDAYDEHHRLRSQYGDLLKRPEDEQITALQEGYVNFYASDAVNPYVALAADGPWVVTSCGAVIHDSGGYGMLGFGHTPAPVLEAMAAKQVMANIMTANYAQRRFIDTLNREIGHRRSGQHRHPYTRFLCLNSGSESVTMAARMSDINAKLQTEASGRHAKKTIKFLSLKGSFHGRTERPSEVSDSSLPKYRAHLASFRSRDNLLTVAPNDCPALEAAFKSADQSGVFIEAMFAEPVMGEGNPGMAMTPEFYQLARRLTAERGSLLVIDSIQAGLRAHGCLSIMDYPGFETLEPPDMETYSKALNAGQYPLSVLAMTPRVADLYVTGVYGNTMTTNPRALEVACAVLGQVDEALRQNIQRRGAEFLTHLNRLKADFPQLVTTVQGTGLLFSLGINARHIKVLGPDGLELRLRRRGMGVIHGGENALRFTPHFRISSPEVDLIVQLLRDTLSELAVKA